MHWLLIPASLVWLAYDLWRDYRDGTWSMSGV